MTKKAKNNTKKNFQDCCLLAKTKSWAVGIFVLLILIVFLFNRNNINIKSFISNLNPAIMLSPTPTNDFLAPDDMVFDQKKYLDKAISDLSDKLQVDQQEISIVSVERHNFNDASLGCPEKGKSYAQMIIAGYIIVLKYGDTDYVYHGGLDRVVTCKKN